MHASADTVATADWLAARHLRLPAVRRAIETTAEGRAMAEFARFLTADVDSASRTIYLWDARFARTGREDWAALRVRLE
jgi:hypothetical protein